MKIGLLFGKIKIDRYYLIFTDSISDLMSAKMEMNPDGNYKPPVGLGHSVLIEI